MTKVQDVIEALNENVVSMLDQPTKAGKLAQLVIASIYALEIDGSEFGAAMRSVEENLIYVNHVDALKQAMFDQSVKH